MPLECLDTVYPRLEPNFGGSESSSSRLPVNTTSHKPFLAIRRAIFIHPYTSTFVYGRVWLQEKWLL